MRTASFLRPSSIWEMNNTLQRNYTAEACSSPTCFLHFSVFPKCYIPCSHEKALEGALSESSERSALDATAPLCFPSQHHRQKLPSLKPPLEKRCSHSRYNIREEKFLSFHRSAESAVDLPADSTKQVNRKEGPEGRQTVPEAPAADVHAS